MTPLGKAFWRWSTDHDRGDDESVEYFDDISMEEEEDNEDADFSTQDSD